INKLTLRAETGAPSPLGWVFLWLSAALAYVVLGNLCLSQLELDNFVAAFWLPTGLTTALAFKLGYKILPGIFVGEFVIGLLHHETAPLWFKIGVAFSQCLEGIAIVYLGPKWIKGRYIFASVGNLTGFLGAAGVGELLHTLLGGFFLPLLMGELSAGKTWNWFIGGWGGALILAPVLLTWLTPDWRRDLRELRRPEFWLLLTAVLGILLTLRSQVFTALNARPGAAMMPVMLWGAFRLGAPQAALINLVLVVAILFQPSVIASSQLLPIQTSESLAVVQFTLISYLLVALVVMTLNQERNLLARRLERRLASQTTELEEAQEELNRLGATALAITRAIPVGTYTLELPAGETLAKFSFMSERFLEITGLNLEEARADPLQAFACVHPEDYDRWVRQNADAFTRKVHFWGETRLLVQGETRWVTAESFPRDLPDGSTVWEGVLIDITDRKQYEAALERANDEITRMNQALEDRVKERTAELEQSRAQFQRLVEDIGDNFVIFSHTFPDGIVTYASGGLKSVFGLNRADVLGRPWGESVEWVPEDAARVQAFDLESLETGNIDPFEISFTHPRGELRTLKVVEHCVRNEEGRLIAVEGIAEDITAAKQMVRELAAREAQFRILVETANDIVYTLDPQGYFTYLSPNIEDILGYHPQELVGVHFAEVIHPEDLAACETVFRAVMGGERRRGLEYRVRHKDGSWRWHMTSAAPQFDDQGRTKVFLGLGFDFTARKEAETQLQTLNQELARANRLKDQFLAAMSHELRTPLNAILGMAQSLQEGVYGALGERAINSLETIERSGAHLLDLINDILDFAQIEAGYLTIHRSPVAISALAEGSLLMVRPQAQQKNLALSLRLPPHLPLFNLDERRLRQALVNLLGNAVKFTPAGGSVALEIDYAQPAPGEDEPQLSFRVKDTGIGIAEADQTRLFQPFVQIDSALNRQYEGTGLGLALVKRLAELHGGGVTLESQVGAGSCFTLRLPAPVVEGSLEEPAPTPPGETVLSTQAQPLILVAEDNLANALSMRHYLEGKGFTVLTAENGETALDLARSARPDCVLLDIQMPVLDGLEVARRLRQDPDLGKTPIIALTALVMDGDRERCLAAGADDYVAKPVKLRELAGRIRRLLEKSNATAIMPLG
ncbi:MAG: PAS domain S-box protein, partial [Cyanobacteria bacterium RI_101]|nr:PAS domain S-box protein [Cyanobacteria bacterium RI_101]